MTRTFGSILADTGTCGMLFPTCPDCALGTVSEIPIAAIANGLLIGKCLRLYCHDRYRTATFTEREQLRKLLAGLSIDTYATQNQSHAEELLFAV